MLQQAGVQISMDGRGRAFDNIFVERLWRTVKYEEVYLRDYHSVDAALENRPMYVSAAHAHHLGAGRWRQHGQHQVTGRPQR